MSATIVRTQDELDAALADDAAYLIRIETQSDERLLLSVASSQYSASVEAYGSGTVEVFNSAIIKAFDSVTVLAYNYANVQAYHSATVKAHGHTTINAYDTARVTADDTSTVRAYESSNVLVYDFAVVEAFDSSDAWAFKDSIVRAYDRATVRASGRATVEASGSSTVRASGRATVRATPHVAVYLNDTTVTVTGGVPIDVTGFGFFYDDNNVSAEAWCEHYGVEVTNGTAILYKAVHDNYCTVRGIQWQYKPGTTVTADDYDDTRSCGGGLHLCSKPWQSGRYLDTATRYVAVRVNLDDLIPLGDKCKVRSCEVLYEVDVDGNKFKLVKNEKQ